MHVCIFKKFCNFKKNEEPLQYSTVLYCMYFICACSLAYSPKEGLVAKLFSSIFILATKPTGKYFFGLRNSCVMQCSSLPLKLNDYLTTSIKCEQGVFGVDFR